MPLPLVQWQQLALYAAGAALLLTLLFNIPVVGRLLRAIVSIGLLTLCLFMLLQRAPFDQTLSQFAKRLGIDNQQVIGNEVRIPLARNGHFWATARINGVERRMLIDSGATITALSEGTADKAAIDRDPGLVPIVLQTANGPTLAAPGTVDRITLGAIEARNLKVVTSPGLGAVDILGMNFLSQLDSWRVERGTLILVPGRGDSKR